MLQESEENHNHNNNIMNVNKPGLDGRSRLLFCVLQDDFADISVVCYIGLVYPRPHFRPPLRGEAVRNEPAQYISMRAPETTAVVPNGSHYRDSQYRMHSHMCACNSQCTFTNNYTLACNSHEMCACLEYDYSTQIMQAH